MVLDILKSEDGRKAIAEAQSKASASSKGTGIKMLSEGDAQQIQTAVKEVLTDANSSKMLQEMITNPKFAGEYAKAIKSETKNLHKELIKDPEYQKELIQAMKNPEFQKMLTDVMKGTEYRQQTMSVMQDAIQSPLFRLELMNLLKQVMEEETKPKNQKEKSGKQGSSSGGNQASGKQGGGGGGGGS